MSVDEENKVLNAGGEKRSANHEIKVFTIIVGGSQYEWLKTDISYSEVATLFDSTFQQHPERTFSITYKRGHGNKPEGILAPSASVKVKEGMVFSVSSTGQS